MDFKFYFSEQLKRHPSMQYQDVVKLCYQSAFGAEHILSDLQRARAYLNAEFEAIKPTSESIFEQISPDVSRVNLGAWKREQKDLDCLFEAFKNSAFIRDNAKETFVAYLETAEQILVAELPDFNIEEWLAFICEYKTVEMPPVHHSEKYRECEKPSYRIVKMSELEKIL